MKYRKIFLESKHGISPMYGFERSFEPNHSKSVVSKAKKSITRKGMMDFDTI